MPLILALVFFRKTWRVSYLVMLAGLLIDLDHLLAIPIYDPLRCSIGFHPLHTVVPIIVYGLALIHPKTRVLGLGLCTHVALDSLDCKVKIGTWFI